jgi:hypothetical protein
MILPMRRHTFMVASMIRASAIRLLGAVCAALCLGAGPSQAATILQLDYVGSIGYAEVLRLTVSLELEAAGGRYRVTADAATFGNIAKLFPFTANVAAQGRAHERGLQPVRYRSDASILKSRQAVAFLYGQDGRVVVTSDPPNRQSQNASAQGLGHHALDPASAVVAVIVEAAAAGTCRGTVPVFDGFRRFDLLLRGNGPDVVERFAASYYEGPATACTVRVDLGPGFSAEEARSGLIPEQAELWLAPVHEGFPPVPVRVTSQSALGNLLLELVAVRP